MRKFLRENALSLVMLGLFLVCIVGQVLAGHATFNEEAVSHGEAAVPLLDYLRSGSFIEAVFENWESEFLQMALFVVLTKFLRQKGSSESKSLDEPEETDEDPRQATGKADAPWPVHKGGLLLSLYERSLSLALFALFFACFAMHAYGGLRLYNQEQQWHGARSVGIWEFMATSDFWEQSFQNWQSEFLSVAVLVLLSIVLRERGSSQSKPVAAAHADTGT